MRPLPKLEAANDVRVRVMLAGLCRTDVAVAEGRLPCVEPRVLGHEVVGLVEAIGPAVRFLRIGDRVACRALVGRDRLGVDRDGGFADALVVPEPALARVPGSLSWRRAAFVEPVAACLAVKHAPLEGAVHVVGAGRIAELTRRVLAAIGIDVSDSPDCCDVVIETGASAESLARAMTRVRDGGLVVLKGRPAAPITFDVASAVQRELRFHAVGWASFDEAFALLETMPVDDLLGDVSPLEALGELLSANEATKRFVAPDPKVLAACVA